MIGLIGSLWGGAGVLLLLGYAIFRLAPIVAESFSHHFRWYHWVALILNVTFMAYAEGYRGFQKGFSPRIAARMKHINHHPNLWRALLGPFFCLGYFHTSRRRQISVISLTIGIIILILLVHRLDQPWRGIVDAGVVVGLSWGVISLLIFIVQAVTLDEFDHSPEVPEENPSHSSAEY